MFSASRLESLAVGRTADGHAAGFWDVLGEARRTEQLHQRSAGLPLKWPPDPVEFRSAVNGVAGGAAPDRGLHDRGDVALYGRQAAIESRGHLPQCQSLLQQLDQRHSPELHLLAFCRHVSPSTRCSAVRICR